MIFPGDKKFLYLACWGKLFFLKAKDFCGWRYAIVDA